MRRSLMCLIYSNGRLIAYDRFRARPVGCCTTFAKWSSRVTRTCRTPWSWLACASSMTTRCPSKWRQLLPCRFSSAIKRKVCGFPSRLPSSALHLLMRRGSFSRSNFPSDDKPTPLLFHGFINSQRVHHPLHPASDAGSPSHCARDWEWRPHQRHPEDDLRIQWGGDSNCCRDDPAFGKVVETD